MPALVSLAAPAAVRAQSDDRFAEEPTGGVHLPTAALAGEHDATATTLNPAGVLFLGGPFLNLALDLADEDAAHTASPGFGVYFATALELPVLPRVGYGISLEWLAPSRDRLAPDPGSPIRFTYAYAFGLGEHAALGLSWHHFFDDDGAALAGLDTFDLGYSARLGAHWAAGLVVRDLTAPTVAGIPVQRRYELELVSRPVGTDRLELALGGRVGETRLDLSDGQDLDGWLRWSVRLVRGAYLRGEVVSQSLNRITTTATGSELSVDRELRVTAGLELSFGGLGAAAYGSGIVDADGDARARGATLVARLSPEEVPSVLPRGKRIEKLELEGGVGQRKLTNLIAYFRNLRDDGDVVALFVEIDGLTAGWATLRELRHQLALVRRSGVQVFAYLVSGNTRQYFVASAADAIYVDPAGGLRLTGFSGTSTYFKGLFDSLGVEAQFEKIEEYKSAPESWTRSGPTELALAMRNALYDSLYGQLLADIADGRGLAPERVRALVDGGPYTAGDLADMPELVDGVAKPDELSKLVNQTLGASYPVSSAPSERRERWSYPKIAVIYVVGDIVDGKSSTIPILGRKLVGSETITSAISAARADPDVEAIVLRIDSPGGSALASELMAREVFQTRGVKPILCSLGDIAASGGYFAAAGCDWIFAEPMTLTGSIGIFNGKFDLSGLLTKIGLSWVTYERGARASMDSFYRGYTDEERALMKDKLRYYYRRFLETVAEGRGMSVEQVDEVGRGRVWTGAQALEVRLIDELGGMDAAISRAKLEAGLGDDEKVRIVHLPTTEASLLQTLLGGLGGQGERSGTGLLPPSLERELAAKIPASLWHQPDVVQARLPFALELGGVDY